MSYIIGSPEFIKNLDGWLFKNEQKYAEYLARNKAGIPAMFTQYNQTLYRGMRVDGDFINDMTSKGVTLKAHSSWTKDEKLAIKFAKEQPANNRLDKDLFPILIKKKITTTNIILDIHALCMFMGEDQMIMLGLDDTSYDSAMKESEVLIKKGLKINKTDAKVVS